MSVGVFTLYCRNPARGWKIYGAYVRDADFLVYDTNYLYYDNCTFHSENSGDFLGLSADLGDQFGNIPDIFPESQLAAWF